MLKSDASHNTIRTTILAVILFLALSVALSYFFIFKASPVQNQLQYQDKSFANFDNSNHASLAKGHSSPAGTQDGVYYSEDGSSASFKDYFGVQMVLIPPDQKIDLSEPPPLKLAHLLHPKVKKGETLRVAFVLLNPIRNTQGNANLSASLKVLNAEGSPLVSVAEFPLLKNSSVPPRPLWGQQVVNLELPKKVFSSGRYSLQAQIKEPTNKLHLTLNSSFTIDGIGAPPPGGRSKPIGNNNLPPPLDLLPGIDDLPPLLPANKI